MSRILAAGYEHVFVVYGACWSFGARKAQAVRRDTACLVFHFHLSLLPARCDLAPLYTYREYGHIFSFLYRFSSIILCIGSIAPTCTTFVARKKKVIVPQKANVLHWSSETRKQAEATAREASRIFSERIAGSAKVIPLPPKVCGLKARIE